MKKILYLILMFVFTLSAFAQFDDLGVQVNLQGELTYPTAATFRTKNDIASMSYIDTYFAKKTDIPVLKNLTFGSGFVADSYNGGAEVNVEIDTSWFDTNYARTLTFGTGLDGVSYNSKAAKTISINRPWVVDVVKDTAFVADSVQVFIDTTPSVNPADPLTTRTLTIQTPYYLRRASNQTLTASTANTTNVLKNSTSAVPADFSTVSTVSVPNTTYTISAPTETRTAATLSGGGTYTTSYTYYIPKLTAWTDGEFKVLDASGNLIYWVSTQYGAQMGGGYTSHSATDLNAKIWYTCAEYENYGVGYGRKWIQYVYNASNARTIYEHAQRTTGYSSPTIGGIIIQPNMAGNTVGGRSIKAIFGTIQSNTPSGYSYIFLRCSPDNYERSANYPNYAIWRPYNALSTLIQKAQ